MVSVTNNHGFLTDCDSLTGWSEAAGKTLTSTSLTVLHNDWFKITGTASAADKFTYWEYDFSNIDASTYKKWIVRGKTSEPANGLGLKVEIVYANPSGTEILFGSTPQFTTLMKVWKGTITNSGSATQIDKIRLYAVSDAACSAKSVYYDFAFLHAETFTFPNVANGLDFQLPPRYAILTPPGRVGDITQNLGTESAMVHASCNLNLSNWKRSGDVVNGEVFYEIAHKSSSEPWQWLDLGDEQFKATLEEPIFRRQGKEQRLDLTFREYRLSDASNETYVERFGLNL